MALSRDGKSGFGQHNRRFQPNRTAKDWLSSDPQQVDAYLADPHTQFHFSLSAYRDLFLLTKSECPPPVAENRSRIAVTADFRKRRSCGPLWQECP